MAAKSKTIFFCQDCGHESAKWLGQCPACKAWNTFVEETVKAAPKGSSRGLSSAGGAAGRYALAGNAATLAEISAEEEARDDTHIGELNRVLGGGLVRGSLTLVGGDPGIGKSTLLLQAVRLFAADGMKCLYISGEESLKQIKLRANRIGEFTGDLKFLCETNLDAIEQVIEREAPRIVVIDSIQTMYIEEVASAPGSVSQVRESTGVLMRIAKSKGISIFIVGHVTKEGTVAGPRVLEHMVDTVLYFEGDRHASYRILRAVKNRFGSTNEIGVFEMRDAGLKEVLNPSEFMLEGRPESAPGSIVTCAIEGTRPLLLEVQALVTRTAFGYPRRQANGTDYNRVNLLMAVLEKRVGLQLGDCDAYINLAGGMRLSEPALDLSLCLAIVSAFKNRAIDDTTIAFGEVGLSGEVRSVALADIRVQEAVKLGFTRVILPKGSLKQLKHPDGVELIGVKSVAEAIGYI
ncbi:MAG: DNA repair protein RadA [Lachnospiraceae bacterium]|nr:DNA repair protein RadA [Lachnospiraceae bacterium]